MHRVHITAWEGRVGNNLQQLGRALHLAECVGAEVTLPDAHLCDTIQQEVFLKEEKISTTRWFGIKISTSSKKTPVTFTCKKRFNDIVLRSFPELFASKFNSDDRVYSDLMATSVFQRSENSTRMRDVYMRHIRPHLENQVFKNVRHRKLGDDTLIVHLRGGDIMNPKTTHPSFVQAPLSFFTKIISEGRFQKVIVCSEYEQFSNPVVRSLVTYCQNVGVKCDASPRSVAEDMYIIANSKNLAVGGYTSFSRSLVLCSPDVRRIFVPRLNKFNEPEAMITSFEGDRSVRVESYIFPEYFQPDSEWTASDDQKRRMLKYPEEKIKLHSIT